VEAIFGQLSCPSAPVYVHISTSGTTASCNHDSDHAKCGRVYITNITTLSLVDFDHYCVGIERVSSNRNISVPMGIFGLKF